MELAPEPRIFQPPGIQARKEAKDACKIGRHSSSEPRIFELPIISTREKAEAVRNRCQATKQSSRMIREQVRQTIERSRVLRRNGVKPDGTIRVREIA